jgi:hypothetical protein
MSNIKKEKINKQKKKNKVIETIIESESENENESGNESVNESVNESGNESGNESVNESEKQSIQEEAKEAYMKTDFMEKIIKYIKTDDLMRQEALNHKEKIATLKEQKSDLEQFILKYLTSMEEDQINIEGSGKIKKYESTTRSSITKDMIKESICEQLNKTNLIKDKKKARILAEHTYDIMENKREKKTKVCLKRIKERKPTVRKPTAKKPTTKK